MTENKWSATIEENYRFAHSFYMEFAYNSLIASTLQHHGQDGVGELHWRLLRQHQRDYFLPALKKLGLEDEATDAIKAAKFHVLANQIGGLDMGYVEETPEKVWVPYYTSWPRGSLLGALAPQAFLRAYQAWHAHNGRSLGNPRMGYVITHLVCRGDPYDAGYSRYSITICPTQRRPCNSIPVKDFRRSTRRRHQSSRLTGRRHAGSERCATTGWNSPTRSFGGYWSCTVSAARALVEHAVAVNMVQQKHRLIETLGLQSFDAAGIATFIERDRALLDEEVMIEKLSANEYIVRQTERNPRLFPDLSRLPVEIDEALLRGWRTLLELTNPNVTVDMTAALTAGDPHYEWLIRARRG